MKTYSAKEIQNALEQIETLSHYDMCDLWRNTPVGDNIFFRETTVANAFKKRLFEHFGGFTPEISKQLSF